MKCLPPLFLTFSFLFHQGMAQTQNNTAQRIDSLFSKYNSQTPGVAVSVIKDDSVIFEKGYGMANLEYDVPISPQTIFHVASISKQFTTFAIYLLEKQGKISFDDDVRKYIPEVPQFGKKITIKHLCAHTSGLKDQWALLTLAGWRMDDVITTDQILKILSRQKELNFEPGSQFKYSNMGFTLLAEIIKRVSGQSFSQFTKEHIFEPLEMNSTQFYEDNNKIVKNRAYSYGMENDVYEKRNINYSTAGPTSLLTTVADLYKWVMNIENPVVGDSTLIHNYNQISLLDNGEPAVLAIVDNEAIYHAKGQFTRNYRGLNVFNHTGSDGGFKTYLGRFPDEKVSIIIFSNDENFLSYKTGMDIAELYLGEKLNEKEIDSELKKDQEMAPDNFNHPELEDFEGEFLNEELSSLFSLSLKSGGLIMSHKRLDDIELTPLEKDKFSGIITFSVNVGFDRDNNGKVKSLSISNFGASNVIFKKVQ